MNLGGTQPLDFEHLGKIKELKKRYNAKWMSDHLSWCAHGRRFHHDLLPLPYTEHAIENTSERILRVQDFFKERILIENASTYVQLQDSKMKEWEFLSEVAKRSDCNILLDINNIFVNSVNHKFDPIKFLKSIPKDKVKEFHLAGYEEEESILIDTHGASVTSEVWDLFDASLEFFGPIPTLIERDNNIPSLNDLSQEVKMAQARLSKWS